MTSTQSGAPPSSPPRAVVVTVGDELLSGERVNSNAQRVGTALAGLGAPVARAEVVGDEEGAIGRAVAGALEEADLVVVTGGLGPTPDDRTREAVAGALGAPLRPDPELEATLRARFRAHWPRDVPAQNLAQALVPAGARVLRNELGTAPGLAMERGGRWVVLLPGVPRELEGLLAGPVRELVRNAFARRLRPPHRRLVRTTGIPESFLAERVERLLPPERGPVRLAYLPSLHGVDLRFTVDGEVERAEALAWLDRMEEALDELGPQRFEGADLVEAVAESLVRERRTVAVAESCTGGVLAKRLTDRPGSSRWFLGGIVAYADEAKTDRLGVAAELIREHGAVSEAVSQALASGVRRAFGADAGVGITGIAGPDGGSADKPVGTVCYSVALGGALTSERRRFPGDREAVRERSAQAALHLLHRALAGRP